MKPVDDSKTTEQNAKLEADLTTERKEWTTKVTELVYMMKDNKKLSEAQVYQLSYRQQVQEKLATYRNLLEKRQEALDKLVSQRFREYALNYDIKLSGAERQMFINTDCAALKYQVKMLDTQIKYFEECTKTLDNFGFAVRNKIEIVAQQLM